MRPKRLYLYNYFSQFTKIKNINVSNNVFLNEINLENTDTETIDFSNCNSIHNFYLRHSKLTSLDVSNLTNLNEIKVYNNLLMDIPLQTEHPSPI